ncbi:hypothetical protein M0804_000136 [Polistes exclamans]|nr:hypothetical protein M0804_000136 [Polistes exclamans]
MDDFTFYLKFTKPIILNLPYLKGKFISFDDFLKFCSKFCVYVDRVMAALWLNKLTEINENVPKDNLHVEYLKLLLFALQKNNLTGIFTKYPPEGSLPQYPEMNTATDMIKLLIPTKKSSFPSIYTAIGSGMSEFAAIQEIPNFGLHGYYAISNEPLPLWTQNKTRLLKNNGSRKKIFRHKDSLEYKMLKEIDLQQIASKQQMKLKEKLINDIQDNCIANEIDSEEEYSLQ